MIKRVGILAGALIASVYVFGKVNVAPPGQSSRVNVHAVSSSNSAQCPKLDHTNSIDHFGQKIRLNGANIAWSSDPRYARDVGDRTVDIQAFRNHFRNIAAAGGNSARWWLHTNGSVTPSISGAGYVTGLSHDMSNRQVINQMRAVLDAAWSEGILVTIVLFNFDIMCEGANPAAYDKMLNRNQSSYLDNALNPMVLGLKDHPALFAWEVFNESEGLAFGTAFFGDPNLQNCSTGKAQSPQVLNRFIANTAARIHELDRNVKVTSSVGHPSHLKNYDNNALKRGRAYDPKAQLDFYQVHWYEGSHSPYLIHKSEFYADKPIVVGEFAAGFSNSSGSTSDLAHNIFKNGYAGAWVWSQSTETRANVSRVISGGAVCGTAINKSAIEQCIATKDSTCYNR